MELNELDEGAEEFSDITNEPGFVMTPVGGELLVVGGVAGGAGFAGGSGVNVTGGTFRIFWLGLAI